MKKDIKHIEEIKREEVDQAVSLLTKFAKIMRDYHVEEVTYKDLSLKRKSKELLITELDEKQKEYNLKKEVTRSLKGVY